MFSCLYGGEEEELAGVGYFDLSSRFFSGRDGYIDCACHAHQRFIFEGAVRFEAVDEAHKPGNDEEHYESGNEGNEDGNKNRGAAS